MESERRVGILGLGIDLPSEIRRNEDWPAEVVAKWPRLDARLLREIAPGPDGTVAPGVARVIDLQAEVIRQPFHGIRERRVLPQGMTSSDMEVRAAADAIKSANVDPAEIDLLLCDSAVPDLLVSMNAAKVHERLGLHRRCASMSLSNACNAFLTSFSLAAAAVAGGSARLALIVQSCAVSRLVDYSRPGSQFWGDCATAAVIGPVQAPGGLIGFAHSSYGELNGGMAAGAPGVPWYEAGRTYLYAPDLHAMRRQALETLDQVKLVADELFRGSGCVPSDVAFFNTHQGFSWMRAAMQEFLGLDRAKSIDTFSWAGNCFGATLPLGLALGARDGLIQSGDLVFLGGLGAGASASAALMRWGR